jgi:hypothetical protein
MQKQYNPRPPRTVAERQFKKLEQQTEGLKAFAEYQAKQTATLANMERLRLERLARVRQDEDAVSA